MVQAAGSADSNRSARQRMVDSAIVLLAQGGYQATSFSSVLEVSQAPRGSIYHHFPEGKDQLITAAVELAGARAVAVLDSLEGLSAPEVVDGFMLLWRTVLVRSDFGTGCSVLAVTVSSGSDELLDAAADVFRSWGARLTDLLQEGGFAREDAAAFATMVMAASEGAVVLARARHNMEPFDVVATQLREDAERRIG